MRNWDDLKIFLALAEFGTIRAAADSLNMTHVTVARRMRSFEQEIGTILFERLPSGHALTDAGRSILSVAQSAKSKILDIDRLVDSIDTRLDGSVRLALPESLATTLIAPILPDFRAKYPQISLEILLSDQLLNLAGNETDLALRLTAAPPDAAYGRRIANSPLAVYVSHSYLSQRPKNDVWIGLDYEPAQKLSGKAEVAIRANGLLAMAELLASGLGLGVLPCFLGDNHPKLQRLNQELPKPDLDLWLLVHKDLRSVPRVRAVADFVFESLVSKREIIEGCTR